MYTIAFVIIGILTTGVIVYWIVFKAIRAWGRSHVRDDLEPVLGGEHIKDRANRLEKQSREYRNVLVDQMIDRSERRRRE